MFFVRTEGMEGLNAHDTYDPAEDIGLLEVKFDEFGDVVLYKVNSTPDVNRLKSSR